MVVQKWGKKYTSRYNGARTVVKIEASYIFRIHDVARFPGFLNEQLSCELLHIQLLILDPNVPYRGSRLKKSLILQAQLL